jgi:hypothetical protein
MAHGQTPSAGRKHEGDLAAESCFAGRRDQRGNLKTQQARQIPLFLCELLGVRDAGQRAAAADAEVLAVQAT